MVELRIYEWSCLEGGWRLHETVILESAAEAWPMKTAVKDAGYQFGDFELAHDIKLALFDGETKITAIEWHEQESEWVLA